MRYSLPAAHQLGLHGLARRQLGDEFVRLFVQSRLKAVLIRLV